MAESREELERATQVDARRTLEQHDELRRLFDRVRVIASSAARVLPAERMRKLLHHEIEELSERMAMHFEFEESDGYMADVERCRPELSFTLERLLRQHRSIGAALGELVQRSSSSRTSLAALKRDLVLVLDRIAKHESAESEILQRYLLEDIGTCD